MSKKLIMKALDLIFMKTITSFVIRKTTLKTSLTAIVIMRLTGSVLYLPR